MASWSIKNSVSNLLPEGPYQFRLDECKASTTKGNEKNPPTPQVTFQWTVIGGETDGTKQFQRFMMRTDMLGIIGGVLAATQAFDQDEELPDEAESLARICESKLAGKVYDVNYTHRTPKGSDRTYSNIEVVGPTTSNFG